MHLWESCSSWTVWCYSTSYPILPTGYLYLRMWLCIGTVHALQCCACNIVGCHIKAHHKSTNHISKWEIRAFEFRPGDFSKLLKCPFALALGSGKMINMWFGKMGGCQECYCKAPLIFKGTLSLNDRRGHKTQCEVNHARTFLLGNAKRL